MLTTFAYPSVTTTLADSAEGFNAIWNTFLPYATFAITLSLGFGGLALIVYLVRSAIHRN